MPVGNFTTTIRDHSNETSSFSLNTPALSAINIDDYGGVFTAALDSALDPFILGNVAKRTLTAESVVVSNDIPANPYAQREMKWLVPYRDNVTGLPGSFEIPTADLSQLVPNTDLLDTSTTEWDTLRDLLELRARSNAGNAITIGQPRLVGRNI